MDIFLRILVYVAIFAAKLVEVSLATIRMVLINRGEKLKGAMIGFFEVSIWVILVSTVLSGITEDPIKAVAYCLAFSCGNYMGVIIENKLAIGSACIWVVVEDDKHELMESTLRGNGFGVTATRAEGRDNDVYVLMTYLKRRQVSEAIGIIREISPDALITVNDVRQARGGFLKYK